MSRSSSRVWIRRLALTALFVVGFPLGVVNLRYLLTVDPFAKNRGNYGEAAQGTGIRFADAEIGYFRGARRLGRAKVDRIDVRGDRQILLFEGLTDGEYASDKGEVRFTARQATWNTTSRDLDVTQGAHLWSKDLDLRVPAFKFDQSQERLTVPGEIKGRLFKGRLTASNLEYYVRTDRFDMGPVHWVGVLDKLEGLPQAQTVKRTRWDVKGKRMRSIGKDLDEYTEASARDEHGETIVKADKIVVNRKDDVITATGNVRYYGIEANLVAHEVVIFRKEERMLLTGDVRMLVKAEDKQKLEEVEIPPFRPALPDEITKDRPPAPVVGSEEKKMDDEVTAASSRRKYPVLVTAQKVEYWYAEGKRRAIATGDPQARQQLTGARWRQVWADRADYDGEKDELVMTSKAGERDVRFKSSLGHDLKGSRFRLVTKDEENPEFDGEDVEGVMPVDDEDVPRRDPPKTGAGGGRTGGGGLSGPIGKPGRV